MKRTALILAAATAFDLGVMAVAAQAQQQTRTSPVRIPTTSTGPTIPDAASGAAVREPGGSGGCTPGSPLPGGTANPCAPAAIGGERTPDLPGLGRHAEAGGLDYWFDIPARACTARGGVVATREGVQQCRIPNPAAPAIGSPQRNRPIPPR